MGYPRELLNPEEDVIFEYHPSWTFMIGAGFMGVLGIVAYIILVAVSDKLAIPASLIVIFAGLGVLGRYLTWRTTEFVLTSTRLIVRKGIISKQGIEIPLDRITNISFNQKLWERLLGTGDLKIESAGENGQQLFTDVRNPARVQQTIYRAIEIDQGGGGGFGARHPGRGGSSDDGTGGGGSRPPQRKRPPQQQRPPQPVDIPAQIAKLDDLRNRGILSDAEFEQKKKQLLDRM